MVKKLIPNGLIQKQFIKYASYEEQKRFMQYLEKCPTSGPATGYASKILEKKMDMLADTVKILIGQSNFNKFIGLN